MKIRSSLPIAVHFAFATMLGLSIHTAASTQTKIDKRKDEPNASAKTISAGCKKVHDRFSNRTIVSMLERTIFRSDLPHEELSLIVNLATSEDRAPNRPREVELVFISKTERYRYHEQAEVNFIIDGERVSGGIADTLGSVPTSPLVQEKMQLVLPVEKFLRIAGEREVEMKMGQTEVTFQRADLEALHRYATCAGLTSR